MSNFNITRVYADDNGDSRFEEQAFPLTDAGPIGFLSPRFRVRDMIFRIVVPTYNDWHTAPERQFVVLLDGGVQIETSLGEIREFQAGEVLLMDDTTGKGHRSSNLLSRERRSLFITFDELAAT